MKELGQNLGKYKQEILLGFILAAGSVAAILGLAILEEKYPQEMNARIVINKDGLTICDGSQIEGVCLTPVPTSEYMGSGINW